MSQSVIESSQPRSGTQAIERAARILRLLTRGGSRGCKLSEVTRDSGLARPTVRRILKCLTDERLVERDEASKRYRLGSLSVELALAAGERLDFRDRLRPMLERISHMTGDTVYLHVRSGYETVCIDRIDGSYPIRAVTLEIGGRRPLGFGSAGLAMLAELDDDEVSAVLEAHECDFRNSLRIDRESILNAVKRTRVTGFGLIRDTTVMGVAAIGVAINDRDDLPMLGVAIAMVDERLPLARARSLYRMLKQEIDQI